MTTTPRPTTPQFFLDGLARRLHKCRTSSTAESVDSEFYMALGMCAGVMNLGHLSNAEYEALTDVALSAAAYRRRELNAGIQPFGRIDQAATQEAA